MCHQIKLVGCDLEFDIDDSISAIKIYATCKSLGKTGVEMEALSACSLAALTIYDMCKAVDKKMVISNIHLVEKTGGKSEILSSSKLIIYWVKIWRKYGEGSVNKYK